MSATNFVPNIDFAYAYFLQSQGKHNILFVNSDQPIVEKTPLWFYLSFHGFGYNDAIPDPAYQAMPIIYNLGIGNKVDPLYQLNGFLVELKQCFRANYQYHLADLLYLLKYCTYLYRCGKDTYLQLNPAFHNLLQAAEEVIVDKSSHYVDTYSNFKDVVRLVTILYTSTNSPDTHLMFGILGDVFKESSARHFQKLLRTYGLRTSSIEDNPFFPWKMQTGTSTFDHTRGIVNSLTAHPVMGIPLSQQQTVVTNFQKRIEHIYPYSQ